MSRSTAGGSWQPLLLACWAAGMVLLPEPHASAQEHAYHYRAVVEAVSIDAHPKVLLMRVNEQLPGSVCRMHPGSDKLLIESPHALTLDELSAIVAPAGFVLRSLHHAMDHAEHVDTELLNTYPVQQQHGDPWQQGAAFDQAKAAWIEANPDAYRTLTEGPRTAQPTTPAKGDAQDD